MSRIDSEATGPSPKRPVLVLVLLVAFLALPAIPTRELMPTDEPRFALVARQMVEDPAPIVPHLGYDPLTKTGEVYGDKPPVFFWLISFFSFLTGGVNEISARMPSFLAAVAAVLLTRRIGILLAGEATGFAAGAILATTSQFFLRAGWCSIDMLLTALTLAASYCWLAAARAGPPSEVAFPLGTSGPSGSQNSAARAETSRVESGGRRTTLAALGGLFAAAATLSKGPVGLIYPLIFFVGDFAARTRIPELILTYRSEGLGGLALDLFVGHGAFRAFKDAGVQGRVRFVLRMPTRLLESPSSPAGVAAIVSYIVPLAIWIAAISLVGGESYVREILFRQNVTRYVAAWNNQQPWYYYLYRLPIGLFPWTLLLPAAILAPRGLPVERARPLHGLVLASTAIFLFFSVSTGKRGVYLLPLYPALAILTAAGWDRVASRPFRAIAAVHTTVLAAVGGLGIVALPIVAHRRAPGLVPGAIALGLVLAVTTIASAILFFRGRARSSLRVLLTGVAALVCAGSVVLVPEANRRSGLRSFGAQLAAVARPDDFIVVDQEGYEQILFYSHLKGARRSFERTGFSIAEDGSVVLVPRGRPASGTSSQGSLRDTEPGSESRREGSDEVALDVADPSLASGHRSRESSREGGSGKETTGAADEAPVATEAERAAKAVRFPPSARVLFVVKGPGVELLRAALGPSCRTLLAGKIADVPVFVVASR